MPSKHAPTREQSSLIMADAESSSSDESVDPTSEKFNPLKALYSSRSIIPVPNAQTYDNLTKYEAAIKGVVIKHHDTSKAISKKDESFKRHFLPHQEPVSRKNNQRDLSQHKNVLSKMENALGPLQLLRNCMETKIRIKVFTRSARGIRGFIEAYVAAFDKHWNLALEDCTETWTRKIRRKAPALGVPIKLKITEEDVPKVIVKETNGKTETLMRHVSQMLLRGEQVATIIVLH